MSSNLVPRGHDPFVKEQDLWAKLQKDGQIRLAVENLFSLFTIADAQPNWNQEFLVAGFWFALSKGIMGSGDKIAFSATYLMKAPSSHWILATE